MINKKRLLTLIFCCLCLIFLIPSFFFNYTNFANAEINVSGNRLVLTGLVGNTPQHYFTINNDSTLTNIEIFDNDQTHYSLKQGDNKKGMQSSGSAEILPTSDITTLINKGLVYFEATMTVTTKKSNEQSNIELIINYDSDKQVSVSTNNQKGQTSILSTGLVQLSKGSKITYYFHTLQANTDSSKSDFIIDMPCIKFYTVINDVFLDMDENITTNAGEYIKINAYNEITNVSGVEGNFINYSKVNHKINYNFVSGGEYVTIVGDKFFIDSNTPNGTKIKFNVYSKKTSYNSEEYVYSSNYVTINVQTEKVALNILTDFQNAGTISGSGLYNQGERVTLTATAGSGFQFIGWQVNGEIVSTRNRYIIEANFNDEIYAKFKKSVKISAISSVDKIYDGTTYIDSSSLLITIDGLEQGHELNIEGIISGEFSTKNVGVNLPILIKTGEQGISLSGANSDIYILSNYSLPIAYGNIVPRSVIANAVDTYKQYKYSDPVINYEVKNLVEGDKLSGYLSRESGENIGSYEILLGSLGQNDSNYSVNFIKNDAKFYITQREIDLINVSVSEKIYDKTLSAEINADLTNIVEGEDVSIKIIGEFTDYNVGYNKVIIKDVLLLGNDADNYIYTGYDKEIYGIINEAPIKIKVPEISITYGDDFSFDINDCEIVGLIDGDTLGGKLEMNGKDVNIEGYDINIGTVESPNYRIETFEKGRCYILQKNIDVFANNVQKIYGDNDPIFTFKNSPLAYDDVLIGNLTRESGEDCGSYDILVGEIEELNPNYKINFVSASLIIIKRDIIVNISFLDKVYDGTNNVQYNVNFENNIKNDYFECVLFAYLKELNCGESEVNINNISVIGDEDNYNFNISILNNKITISRCQINVLIQNKTKVYGEQDPSTQYSLIGVINNETINGEILREEGEEKGIYYYNEGTMTSENNPNYYFVFSNSYLEILPKQINIIIEEQEKIYGDNDPEFTVRLENEEDLVFEDKAEDVLTGKISRQSGESAGIYKFDISDLSSNKNYNLNLSDNCYFIILRRNIDVIIDDASKVYGEDDPVYSYTVNNLIQGDEFYISIARDYGEDVGTYKLYNKTLSDDRYIIDNVIFGNLTITPRDISLKAEQKIKIYGDKDPSLSVVVTEGRLVDDLSQISVGNLTRTSGESVGIYEINLGTFSLGKNYNITFEGGQFIITKADITISANFSSKQYGDKDPTFTYQIVKGSLKYNDSFFGMLEREQGEEIGKYEISLGTLIINENYNLSFLSNTFEIVKRNIEIIPTSLSQIYGEESDEIIYNIVGSIVNDDEKDFTGSVYRDKGTSEIESVGKYKIYCSLYHENYNVIFGEYYFEILPRQITIIADDKVMNYGDEIEPELTYTIEGDILKEDKDKLNGEIYRNPGNNAGEYLIQSSLNLGKNYNINFIRGVFTIKPLDLVINCNNYEKVYGQIDPKFTYEIIEGQLINNDSLNGNVTREQGEDVGLYKLTSTLRNVNYNIKLVDSYLTITPKQVYLTTSIYDKTYDGTNIAYIKNPYVTGIIDNNISIEYDRENSARFETSQVGNNIKVYIYDISLSGDKAKNYELILPKELYANIAKRELSKSEVTLSSPEQAVLYDGYELNFDSKEIDNGDLKIKSHKSLIVYDVHLVKDSQDISLDTTITISINLDEDMYSYNNIYVYQQDNKGDYKLVSSYKEDGKLIIVTDKLGEFVIVTDNEDWIDIGMFISISMLIILLAFAIARLIIKNKKNKKIH